MQQLLLNAYKALAPVPGGLGLLSRAIWRKAPYFRSAAPRLVLLKPDYCEVSLSKRRAVENHIGTVHVIAICNALEFAMGVLAEASVPAHLRWIPMGMNVRYTAKASSDLTITASVAPGAWERGPELEVAVEARRNDGTVVVTGHIQLWVTPKS